MLLYKLFQFGVLPRDSVKNNSAELKDLLRKKFVQRVSKKGRVFYELTEKSLPLLEEYRNILLHRAKLLDQLQPHAKFYRALLGELRLLNEKHPDASDYQLLGDWQLTRPTVSSQLGLSKFRYYQNKGL